MTTVVSIEVFIVFVIAAFIFGGFAALAILSLIIAFDKKEDEIMQKENNPCFKCADRKAFCHIGCEKEKEYIEKRKAEREKINAIKEQERDMKDYQATKSRKYYNFKTGKYWGK